MSLADAPTTQQVNIHETVDFDLGYNTVEDENHDLSSMSLATGRMENDALFQLNEIVTPVRVDRLAYWLEGYDESEKKYLLNGFREGFSILCEDLPTLVNSAKNQKPAIQKPEVLQKLLEKEIKNNRIAGPYSEIPFKNLHVSPLSIRPKKTPNAFRLIHNLSSPLGDSVNDGIPKEQATVQYETLDDAIKIIQELGPSSYMAKSDIQGAFRIIPVLPEDRLLLGMEFRGAWFFDKNLAMGARTSCMIFTRFSRALQWICKEKLGIKFSCHVLDDFLFLNKSKIECQSYLDKFKALCEDIGVPLAMDKTFGPDQILEFLGILLDTIRMLASLPLDKVKKCKQEILQLLPAKIKKVRVKQIQSVVGLLNFACRVVRPGRAFLRRLIDQTCGFENKYHRVRITQGIRDDLKMWLSFLDTFNGSCMIRQPEWSEDTCLVMYSDSCKTGYGFTCGNNWCAGNFPPEAYPLNITVLELFPILLCLLMLKDHFSNKRVIVNTDNKDLVSVISKKTSKEKMIMPLVRELVLHTMNCNIMLQVRHVRGLNNGICDALSRGNFQRFRELAPSMPEEPLPIPRHLLPSAMLGRLMLK